MNWSWILFAIASLVLGSVLSDKGIVSSNLLLLVIVSAVVWFFVTLALGGKKGVPFGAAVLVFAGCLLGVSNIPRLFGSSFNLAATKQLLHSLKYGEVVLVYLGLISLLLFLIIAPPIYVGRKLWKPMTKEKPKDEPKKDGEKKEKERKVRGRLGIG